MVQDDDFAGSHLLLGNNQGADHVIGHAPSSIPQNMGITKSQAQCWCHVKAGIHTGHNGYLRLGLNRKMEVPMQRHISLVGCYKIIKIRHGLSFIPLKFKSSIILPYPILSVRGYLPSSVTSEKREWDRNRSFVRIRFRRPTSAQLSRAVKADESSVVEPTQPLRLARQSKNN